MNKKTFSFIIASIVLVIFISIWFFYTLPVSVTLYMYEDKPSIAEEIAKELNSIDNTKVIYESLNYVFSYPEVEPWREYVYVISGNASPYTLQKIESKYRKYCYNLATEVKPKTTSLQRAVLWSSIY